MSFLNYFLKNELFISLALIFVVSFYISAKDLDPISFNYPKGIIIVLAILFIWTLFSQGKEWYQKKEEWYEGRRYYLVNNIKEYKKPLLMLVMLLIYISFLDNIGFYISTGIFLLSMFIILGERRPLIILLNLIGLLLLSFVIFTVVLNIPLPRGMFL